MATVRRWTGHEARALRQALRQSVRVFAEDLGVAARTISKWEAGGEQTCPRPDTQAILDTALGRADGAAQERFGLLVGEDVVQGEMHWGCATVQSGARHTAEKPADFAVPFQIERLRQGLTRAVGENALSSASLDEWEETVLRHAEVTRDRAPRVLLGELCTDLAELQGALSRCRSASALRRLTRVTAQMAGLVCLTLIKMDDGLAFRRWARTARVAADEAGDPETLSWVRAQEAYGHYYSGDLAEAIEVAQHAQALAGQEPCVGTVLAAALEARAQAALGCESETRAALARAEAVLCRLDAGSTGTSAFDYNEAQLRFHEGNAFTHLHDTPAAWRAQQRALALCPPSDYMDRTMIQLDRASCLAHDGDTTGAMAGATGAVASLTDEQRRGIISLRTHDTIAALPAGQRGLPAVRDLRELLASADETKG